MPDTLYVGNVTKGQVNNRTAFNIDNDAFPLMTNAYSWRGRVKRKRGTTYLGRLQIQSELVATTPEVWQDNEITLLNGEANLLGSIITNITQANPAVATIRGGIISPQDLVKIDNVRGMVNVNGNFYRVLAVTDTTITLDLNSTSMPAYTGGGTATIANTTLAAGTILLVISGQVYTDPFPQNGTLIGNLGGTGVINYTSGMIQIANGASNVVTGNFSIFPSRPVMGLKNFLSQTSLYPLLLAFDTEKSYQFLDAGKFFYNTSYYKSSKFPTRWFGQDFEQFWTTNYSGALWATNGNPGFHYLNGTYTSGSSSNEVTFNFKSGGANFTKLLVGDYLFFNEWPSGSSNGLTGVVSTNSDAANGNYVVTFTDDEGAPENVTFSGNGIVQMLTNESYLDDGIKWYDGDPTDGTGLPTSGSKGWVNFAPPLSNTVVSINNLPQERYYLVGALMIYAFKDRLLFFSPYIQAVGGNAIQLRDTVIWSWNGTPYYNKLTPFNQTYDIKSYYVDQTGLGGYLSSGLDQNIVTLDFNQDVLLIGFTSTQTRFVYTGDDINPFLFFGINFEYGAFSTFASITMDAGALTVGPYGIVKTDQQNTQRIDLEIPDQVFQIQQIDNGAARVNAIRDFYREWITFTYPTGASQGSDNLTFPNRTFFYNYREGTWAIFKESYTCQGSYRSSVGFTWDTIPYPTWDDWNTTWDSGVTYANFASIIAGNAQGYVLIKDEESTNEAPSGTILSINGLIVSSADHCVEADDYLYITGCLGITSLNGTIVQVDEVIDKNTFKIDTLPVTKQSSITGITQANPCVVTTSNTFQVGDYVTISGVVGMVQLNGNTYRVDAATSTTITLNVNSTTFTAYSSGGTISTAYMGLGTFSRLSVPDFRTKQFNPYWDQGKKVRLQSQKYLFDFTQSGQVTINIYLNQNDADAWNNPEIADDPNGLIYSQIVYTCPESTNLGLSPANTNLQMPTAKNQQQIWHRMNTSLLGDTFQIGVTLSESQMKDPYLAQAEISCHAIQATVSPSAMLS